MAKKRPRIKQIDVAKLDSELIKEAMKLNKGKTIEQVINEALRKYIIGVRNREVLDIKEKILFWDGYLEQLRDL